jgi:hypothetical protein
MPVLLNAKLCMSMKFIPALQHLARSSLEVVLLACLALGLALADNLLAEPLSGEALLQLLEVLDNIAAALDDRILGRDCAVGRDAQLKGREERVGDLVGGEDDVVVLEKALREKIAEGVVLFVEREDGRVGDAYSFCCVNISKHRGRGRSLRVSSLCSTLDWPSSSRNNSNLSSALWLALSTKGGSSAGRTQCPPYGL